MVSEKSKENLKKRQKKLQDKVTREISLDARSEEQLRSLGSGNLSKGCRIAASLTKGYPKGFSKQQQLILFLEAIAPRLPEPEKLEAEEFIDHLHSWSYELELEKEEGCWIA